jgi:UDP:flavonoid glycosyltransferase YjiC (YdhE family)
VQNSKLLGNFAIYCENGTEKLMKIVLATFGSRGDVQPMLALSLALISKGHDVLLAAPPEKAAWANQLGCPFYPLGSDVTAFIVPHLLDQYYWGNQIYRSNLGPRPIWRSELTSKRLAATIRECLSNDRIRQKAKEASVIIKQQDSLEFTVSEILRSLSN